MNLLPANISSIFRPHPAVNENTSKLGLSLWSIDQQEGLTASSPTVEGQQRSR